VSGSLNKAIVVGNLGKDPDIRFMPDGSKVASFSVATNEHWEDKATGEKRERTEWHRISVFNERLAEVTEKYVRKGTKVYVEGQIQTRKWVDKTGNERITTEIVLGRFRGELIVLDPKKTEEVVTEARRDSAPSDIAVDDEIPFS
jgi:single-strand DNA-binding protein